MSSFDYSGEDSIPSPVLTHPFDHEAFVGYESRVPSQQFDSFDLNSATDSPIFNDPASPYSAEDEVFRQNPAPRPQYQSTIYAEADGTGFDGAFEGSNGPILPPPTEMGPDEGYALREWRRKNAIRLEEKEKREKELLNQIIDEADEYKVQFYRKRIITCENNKITNREREKVYQANQGKFHSEADKNRWKAIAELLPNEVPAIEKRRGKKDQEKKPSINVVQGPKPGKPTDLSRMRQILLKLKHNTPPHLKPTPPPAPAPAEKDPASADPPSNATVSLTPQAVVVT